jgi:hypothetical protein
MEIEPKLKITVASEVDNIIIDSIE